MAGGLFAALDEWRLIRRYAVPNWMIAECAEARERDDWRAACAAARVTVTFDDPDPVAGLLAGFAPDLLRWHLPRSLDGTAALVPRARYVLAPDGPVTADTLVLGVRSPGWKTAAQRLTLHVVRAGDIAPGPVFLVPPHMWDTRRAHELRAAPPAEAVGSPGAWAAAGWLLADGPSSTGPQHGRPGHRCDRRGCRQHGRARHQCSRYGCVWDDVSSQNALWREDRNLDRVSPTLAAIEVCRVSAQFGRRSWELRKAWCREPSWQRWQLTSDGVRHRLIIGKTTAAASSTPFKADFCLHPELLRAPADLDLVRYGRVDVADVHPLVRAALFPSVSPGRASTNVTVSVPSSSAGSAGRAASQPSVVPASFTEGERVRIRCGGGWHQLLLRRGRLELPDHHDDERQREMALRTLGGVMSGCFAAELAWHRGEGFLPRRLREQRHDLWRRMHHGGGRVVAALLDAGMDPHIRDRHGRTLLHRIHQFDDVDLLHRLLAAGVDVNAVDRFGSTAMCEALVHAAPAELYSALNAAGAAPGLSLLDPASWPEPVGAVTAHRLSGAAPRPDPAPDVGAVGGLPVPGAVSWSAPADDVVVARAPSGAVSRPEPAVSVHDGG
ncbi:ankyrin repeat domain-containing protein [Dactylosporangium sp. NBC_01737]|uniref:ankyrin repeat domain-containing protein n=1 Tax=Dactylosporangium sp. NBC_01737 TaxID=2975959 RepID=UPI002E165D2A|nr:ankyrin repeat domain-containing protein [Dactylosporangium sp. NBC_01737]